MTPQGAPREPVSTLDTGPAPGSSPSATSAAPPTGVVLATVAVAGSLLGVLTAYGQAWLPHEVASLANSSGTWCLAACLLSLLARRRSDAAACGALVLASLLAGYVLGADLRGFPSSRSVIAYWGLAAVLVGPVLGLAAHAVARGSRAASAAGAAVMGGVLVGEGIWGLTVIAGTTSPPYWWGQIALGVVLVAGIAVRRGWEVRNVVAAAVATGVVAALFVRGYGLGLIELL